jgi:hypothetical protein
MRKVILTGRAVWILLLVVAAVTGNRVENVKYWKRYGESRLHKALNREVGRKQLKLNNSYRLLFIYLLYDAISASQLIRG